MERRALGLTGITLPVVGVGARAAFDVIGKEGQSARRALVDVALTGGANFFETSPESGDADGILAAALTGRRNRATVAATIDPADNRLAHARIDRLLRLFEERLDLLAVEGPLAWDEFRRPFHFMKSARSIRAAGISCPDPAGFQDLAVLMERAEPDFIQIPYNPASPEAATRILPLAAEMEIGVIVVQPFEGGWMLDLQRVEPVVEPLKPLGVNTFSQVILKWILSDRRVSSVVVGTRRQRNLRSNIAAGDPPWMADTDRDRVTEFFRAQVAGDSYRW